jgi:hypothetical protein
MCAEIYFDIGLHTVKYKNNVVNGSQFPTWQMDRWTNMMKPVRTFLLISQCRHKKKNTVEHP